MVQQLLLAGQALVVLVVYLFVWRVIRSARADLVNPRTPRAYGTAGVEAQESTIIPAADVQAARRQAGLSDPRLVVQQGEVLRAGIPFSIGGGLAMGRAAENDVVLDEGVVSGRHARVLPPGVVVDDGSTNGTFVNGARVDGRVPLRDGDLLQVGTTVFRFEAAR